jgi:hypothetical protein
LITTGIGHGLVHVHLCSNKDRSPSCLRHPFGYVTFSFLKLPNGFSLLEDSFYSYMSSYLDLWPQIWNCLVPPGKFQALVFNYFVFC